VCSLTAWQNSSQQADIVVYTDHSIQSASTTSLPPFRPTIRTSLPSPTDSPSKMTISFPSCDGGLSPADQVPVLVAKAQAIKALSPPLSAYLATHKQLFLNVFSRHIQLLKSRSQAFEDGHITVYDKALLTLTRNGNDLESAAAIEFYCEEFLGIDKQGTHTETYHILQQSVLLPAFLSQAFAETAKNRCSTPRTKSEDLPAVSFLGQKQEMEPKLGRLWSVYEQARTDFFAVSAQTDPSAITAAKFLRDTAENALGYLKNENPDPIMLTELNAMYHMAKTIAVSLSGGKKRKFDQAEMDQEIRIPHDPGNLPSMSGRHWRSQAYSRSNEDRHGHSGTLSGHSRPVDSYHPH